MLTPTFSNPRRLFLLFGDVATLLAFAALGRRAHSRGSALDDVIGTALPFLITWLLVALISGAYSERATENGAQAARRSALTWLAAFPLGLILRTAIVGRWAHISFAIVAGIFTLVMLTGWRTLFALALSRKGN